MPIAELRSSTACWWSARSCARTIRCIAQRLRQAAKRGAQIHVLHSVDDDWLMPIASKKIVPPSEIARLRLLRSRKSSKAGKNAAILLGNFAQQHPQAAQIHAAAQAHRA